MRGLKLKSMSFDDLVALRDNVVRMISDKASSARRELEAKLSAIEGLGLGIGGGVGVLEGLGEIPVAVAPRAAPGAPEAARS